MGRAFLPSLVLCSDLGFGASRFWVFYYGGIHCPCTLRMCASQVLNPTHVDAVCVPRGEALHSKVHYLV